MNIGKFVKKEFDQKKYKTRFDKVTSIFLVLYSAITPFRHFLSLVSDDLKKLNNMGIRITYTHIVSLGLPSRMLFHVIIQREFTRTENQKY